MVNRGPSKGCHRCRELHTKCDQTKPGCQKCIRRGIICPGYRDMGGIVIKDVTTSVVRKHTAPIQAPTQALTAPPCPSNTRELMRLNSVPYGLPSHIVSGTVNWFFDKYVVSPGKGMLPSSAYFDHLIPLYLNADDSSSLTISVNAMATRAFRLQSQAPFGSTPPSTEDMKALQAVQRSLALPEERLRDETLLAILCLDFAEHLVISNGKAAGIQSHMLGAAALVNSRSPESFKDNISRSLLAGTISSLLLIALWKDRSDQQLLNLIPDIDLMDYDHTVGLHQMIVKAIQSENKVIHDHKGTSYRPSKRTHPELFEQLLDQYRQLLRWLQYVPEGWKCLLYLGSGAILSEELFDNESRPMREIAYVFAQWYCTRMTVLRVTYALLDSGYSLAASESSMLQSIRKEAQKVAEGLLVIMPALHDGSGDSPSSSTDSPPAQSPPDGSPPSSPHSPPPPRRGRREGAPECRGDLKNILRWIYSDLVEDAHFIPGFSIEPATLQIIKDKHHAVTGITQTTA